MFGLEVSRIVWALGFINRSIFSFVFFGASSFIIRCSGLKSHKIFSLKTLQHVLRFIDLWGLSFINH